jgi:hypothetical protein
VPQNKSDFISLACSHHFRSWLSPINYFTLVTYTLHGQFTCNFCLPVPTMTKLAAFKSDKLFCVTAKFTSVKIFTGSGLGPVELI